MRWTPLAIAKISGYVVLLLAAIGWLYYAASSRYWMAALCYRWLLQQSVAIPQGADVLYRSRPWSMLCALPWLTPLAAKVL